MFDDNIALGNQVEWAVCSVCVRACVRACVSVCVENGYTKTMSVKLLWMHSNGF